MSKYLKNIQVFSRRLFHSLKSRVVQRHTRVSHEHKVPRHGHPFVHVWVTTTRHSASIFFPSLLLPSPLLSLSIYISLHSPQSHTQAPLSEVRFSFLLSFTFSNSPLCVTICIRISLTFLCFLFLIFQVGNMSWRSVRGSRKRKMDFELDLNRDPPLVREEEEEEEEGGPSRHQQHHHHQQEPQTPIVDVDAIDDDVVESSPRSFAQVIQFHSTSSIHLIVILFLFFKIVVLVAY